MISMKCRNCGGEMSVDGSGNLYCGYCGSKYAFQDKELADYRNFRSQMLSYLKGIHEQKENGIGHEDLLWNHAEKACFETVDGNDVVINYLYSYEDKSIVSYLAKNNAIFVFPKAQRDKGILAERNVRSVAFPAADVKGLQDCFPRLVGTYELKDGGLLLAYERKENLFPLSMFGSLSPKHVAWIISRLENICCVLEFSSLIHGGISEESVWINPFNHHAVLQGGWQYAVSKERPGRIVAANQDLQDLRKTAKRVLGVQISDAPEELLAFLDGVPAKDAYSDFETWDQVIEKGFGGRHFAKMDPKF